MKEIHKFVLAGVLCGASCLFTYAQELYKNENAPVHERVADLLSRLTVEEKISLLRATSPGIPRLGIDKYYHGNEALHGVVRPGALPFFRKLLDWRRLGIRCCSKKWLLSFLMKRVPVGMNWIREEIRKSNLAMY